VTTSTENPAGLLPHNWDVVGLFWDITTSAEYDGIITVGIPYAESYVEDESTLAIFHWNAGSWQNITTSVDTVNNVVYGQASSLSPFFVGQQAAQGQQAGSDLGDLEKFVQYVVGLIGAIVSAIGSAIGATAADAGAMNNLSLGIFGENGGLIYWLNEKILWMLEQVLAGLGFTSPL
jgi:hypothetical protein